MRKIKTTAALCLAVALLIPLAFSACDTEESATPPTVQHPDDTPALSPEESPDDLENGDTDGETSTPTAPETPPEPQPETPPMEEEPIARQTAYIRCVGDRVNLRSGAGTSYAVLGSAQAGEIYALVETVGGWYKTYYRGKAAYVSAAYFTVLSIDTSDDERVERVLNEGYKHIGVPYVYGAVRLHNGQGKLLSGFTAQKFDCSSLVQYVFYKGADKLLQVNTRTQVKQGEFVAKSDLRRGDCIFFTNESRQYLSGIERIGHVAIYLGDNYILHTSSDYARIEKITAQRWRFYVETRRFV